MTVHTANLYCVLCIYTVYCVFVLHTVSTDRMASYYYSSRVCWLKETSPGLTEREPPRVYRLNWQNMWYKLIMRMIWRVWIQEDDWVGWGDAKCCLSHKNSILLKLPGRGRDMRLLISIATRMPDDALQALRLCYYLWSLHTWRIGSMAYLSPLISC